MSSNPYSAFCEDFYVNMRLGSQMNLPNQRETVLHFFERVQKEFPGMTRFRREDSGTLSLEEERKEEQRTLPMLSAASRAYRADTSRMLWSREERLADSTSSSTLTEFRAAPNELTDRLVALAAPLALKIAAGFAKDAGLIPAPPPIVVEAAPAPAPFAGSPAEISTAPVTAPPERPFATSAPPSVSTP